MKTTGQLLLILPLKFFIASVLFGAKVSVSDTEPACPDNDKTY